MNLIDGLNQELKRAKELKKSYESIPTGGFGVAVIRGAIQYAEKSIQTEDIVEMLKAYNNLQKLK